ncbi:MAG: MbnP family protein [Bacteroidota bacterium]
MISKLFSAACSLLFPVFILMTGLSSCYTPTEGCLNIEATNFDAAADESCNDCCTFPQLQLTINHAIEVDGVINSDSCITHSRDSVLTNDGVNFFQLQDIAFYLSDFELVMPTGDIFVVEDTISLMIYEDLVSQSDKDTTVKDDFVLIERGLFSYDVGEFRTSGTFSQIRFKVGIPPRFNTTNPDTLAASHPLSSEQAMHTADRSSGYIFQQFSIDKDTSADSTDIFIYNVDRIFTSTIQIDLPLNLTFEPGFDLEIPLKVNYTEWLQGINFATDDDESIKTQIVENTAGAFEIDN